MTIVDTADADTLYAVYLPSRHPSPKVRALIDHLVEAGRRQRF